MLNPPRPSTAAAVAAVGTGIESDAMLMGGDGDYGGQVNATGRPNTAGVMGSRGATGQGQWAGGQQMKQGAGSGGYGSGGNGGLQQGEFDASGARRPHTASATGRSAGGGVYGGQQHVQVDPRTSKPVQSGEGEEEGDDAHVVAGARAMMRYRRTRASGR